MGAINFNPAQVIERLSHDRGREISRLASLAGGHRENEIFAQGAQAENPGFAPADLQNGEVREIENPEGAPANPANLLNGGSPAEWLKGIQALDPDRPLADFPSDWWQDLIRDAERFLPVWGRQAADLGWTTLDLFGAHRGAPAHRYSCMGLLILVRGGRIVAISAKSAVIERQSGARLTYTRQPSEPECVAIWELALTGSRATSATTPASG
jgi:hypothetical protein